MTYLKSSQNLNSMMHYVIWMKIGWSRKLEKRNGGGLSCLWVFEPKSREARGALFGDMDHIMMGWSRADDSMRKQWTSTTSVHSSGKMQRDYMRRIIPSWLPEFSSLLSRWVRYSLVFHRLYAQLLSACCQVGSTDMTAEECGYKDETETNVRSHVIELESTTKSTTMLRQRRARHDGLD